ncbi:PspC domain-containing protein [Nocardia miyunensis]|uniref:PspC domain-containing protein n=1 Tax=Nocardia miyunensis TaxID=282684 RepID=UPI000831A87E|nr:PspC domain-containing protein [Nocardia miyunensis]
MTRANGWTGGTGRRTGFNEQLHHLWRTRPVRLPSRGPVAGVAAGFGHRYGVDPVLVRVAFVVSTIFGGSGIVLYLLAWLLMPAEQDDVSAAQSLIGRGHSMQSPTKTLVLIVALVIAVSTVGPAGAGLGGAGVISFALMVAGWWLLYLRQPNPPAGSADPLLPDGGPAPTGYPGVFPGGPPWTGPTYGPYTRLPDHYEPDIPKDAAEQDVSSPDAITEAIAREPDAGTAGSNTAVLRSDAPVDSPVGEEDSSGTAADEELQPRTTAPNSEATQPITPPRTGPYRPPPDPSRIRPNPAGWDPLGVSPLAWDLPDPTPRGPVAPPPPPPRPRSRLTPIVIGSAVLAAAVAGALAAAGVSWMTPGRIGAVALAVVGLGLLIGAFLRRGYGLMVLLAPLAGFVVLASLVGPVTFDRSAMGEHTWKPATMAELNPAYRITVGDGTLDLRSLHLTENRTVAVQVRAGDFRVVVPASMRLDARCRAKVGDITCPQGLVGPATGPVLTLDVDVQAGDAEVTHG